MWRQNVQSLQCDAAHIPLADESVDLIVTSPPYFALRDYQEDGQSLKGQLGNEPTPAEFLDALWRCTEEWMRVLKPRGSIFVNLGDKWAGSGCGAGQLHGPVRRGSGDTRYGFRPKSLMNLPARYAIGCTDQLGLIQREEIVWSKPSALPESVRDRCRRSHELIYHFTKNGDYYSAVDRIRATQLTRGSKQGGGKGGWSRAPAGIARPGMAERDLNPKGKLPSSVWDVPVSWPDILAALQPEEAARLADAFDLPEDVWEIAAAPLNVPRYAAEDTLDGESFEFDHFAAYPPGLVQKVILGWSPKDVCSKCGQGRFPVTVDSYSPTNGVPAPDNSRKMPDGRASGDLEHGRLRPEEMRFGHAYRTSQIIGNACACTPYTDHPERRGKDWRGSDSGDRMTTGQRVGKEFRNGAREGSAVSGGSWVSTTDYARSPDHPSRHGGEWAPFNELNEYGRGQVREYHLEDWEPAPVTPGIVLDPFGGTGTTAITAAKLARRGITCDLSFTYAKRLVEWRMYDLSQNRRR